jgi:hypothetical protein
MPAPTISTSTRGGRWISSAQCTDRSVNVHRRGAVRDGPGVPDRVPKERYYDPDFYRGSRAAAAARVADGVPAQEILSRTISSVRVPRSSVIVRTADMECGHSRMPAATGCRFVEGCGCAIRAHARSTDGATATTARTPPSVAQGSLSTTCNRATSTSSRCGARRGGCADQPSTTTPAGAVVSRPHYPRRMARSRCGPKWAGACL